MLKILGYPDRYSVAPGEEIAFKLSVEEGTQFDARLVRVVHGDANPAGPGLKLRHIPTAIDGRHPGKPQRIDAGSYMVVDNAPAIAAKPFTFFAMIWPTLPDRPDQTLIAQWDPATQRGFRIGVDQGRLSVTLGDGKSTARLDSGKAMLVRQWYSVSVAVDPGTGAVILDQSPVGNYAQIDDRGHAEETLGVKPAELAA
ncbi:MAG: N,N-dimethylformamidase, partial [Bradyrhizobium sp.]|nr:N,N-dimethylformamidase [Bradyrhizobium sp.]